MNSRVATRREARQAERRVARRSLSGQVGGRVQSAYEAASNHPLIPKVSDPSPMMTARQQRHMQVLARHLVRNDPWIRNLVRVMSDIHIGTGPKAISRFPELDALIAAASVDFDNAGTRSHGGWIREDVYRNYIVDGEAFVIRHDRMDDEVADQLLIPIQFQALTSEYCPHDYTQTSAYGDRFVSGIARRHDRPYRYAFHSEHPGEKSASSQIYHLSSSAVYHVFDPITGSARGEVMLASALLRAIKATTLEDSELRRKHVASLMSVFLKRPVDSVPEGEEMPTEEELNELVDSVVLSPGGVFRLPPGYEMQSFTPADEPALFEKALRWQIMAICASAGMPPHEVTGDWSSLPERMARYVGQQMKRRAEIVREQLEHQLLNPMRRDIIDMVIALELWIPPEDLQPWQLYECDWWWPPVPLASLTQELNVMMTAVEKGYLPHSHVSRAFFGLTAEETARVSAKDAARANALGLSWAATVWSDRTDVASRIADEAFDEESDERDLVDEASQEDGVLDNHEWPAEGWD